jgi:hypothetical protein
MTPEARSFIVKCFCRPMTSVEVSYCANNLFDLGDIKLTADAVRKIWNEERESNPVIRQIEEEFGERPIRGFPQNDHMRMAESLVAV